MRKYGDPFRAYLNSIKGRIAGEIRDGKDGAESRKELVDVIEETYNTIYEGDRLTLDRGTQTILEVLAEEENAAAALGYRLGETLEEPEELNAAKMLAVILAEYIRENYPELMELPEVKKYFGF